MDAASFLVDRDLYDLARGGRPATEPFISDNVQPASIDLRLSGHSYTYNLPAGLSLGREIPDDAKVESEFRELAIAPGETVFLRTLERIQIPEAAVGFIFARSSITRIGLQVAPIFINPGYSGFPPLTVTNSMKFSIKVIAEIRFAQLVIASTYHAPERPYAATESKYSGENFLHSKLHDDAEIKAALARVLKSYNLEP